MSRVVLPRVVSRVFCEQGGITMVVSRGFCKQGGITRGSKQGVL